MTDNGYSTEECPFKNDDASITENSTTQKTMSTFEDLLDHIDSRGKFQFRFNVVYNVIGPCLVSMLVHTFQLAVQTPDHWCHVPGREDTNLTVEEWKRLTVPRDGDSYSKCTMYATIPQYSQNQSTEEVVPCRHGWDYDDTWYTLTIPSQQNWVCDDKILLSNAMFISQVLSVALAFFFGYLGDRLGRRIQYFTCMLMAIVSRIVMIFASSVYVVFIVASLFAAASCGPLFETSVAVGLELTDVEHRSTVNFRAMMSMTVGTVLSSLTAWALHNWVHFCLMSTLSFALLLVCYGWFPESPRWFVAKGKFQDALCQLQKIASVNRRTTPPDIVDTLQTMTRRRSVKVGIMSVFSSWNLFKNTVLLMLARSCALMTSVGLFLNVGNLNVNPFLAILVQVVPQFPAYFVGNYFVQKFGRRWTGVGAVGLTAASAAVVIALISASVSWIAVTGGCVAMQLFATLYLGVVGLQSIEVHPTRLRQTAMAFEWTSTGVALAILPYIVFVAGSVDPRLPYAIFLIINLLTTVAVSFLPESARERLPETLKEAATFGRQQPYWSWTGRQRKRSADRKRKLLPP